MSDPGDLCECGRCELDVCDRCGAPVAVVDDYNEAWCQPCLDEHLDRENTRAGEARDEYWALREMGAMY